MLVLLEVVLLTCIINYRLRNEKILNNDKLSHENNNITALFYTK